jgi:hypothetical protein
MRSFLIILTLALLWSCQKSADNYSEPVADEPETAETVVMDNTLTEDEQAQGWELLFDGQSVEHWRRYRQDSFPARGWIVDDGTLVILKREGDKPGGGDIITRERYQDFELQLDFMITDTANSGIFYRAVESETEPIYWSAPEYQILDNDTYMSWEELDFDLKTHLTAENYDLQSAPGDYTNPVGSWNTAKIVVNGNQVEHWLNGNLAVSYEINSEDWKIQVANSKFAEHPQYAQAESGYIGLQDHDHEVRFKNIKIRKL